MMSFHGEFVPSYQPIHNNNRTDYDRAFIIFWIFLLLFYLSEYFYLAAKLKCAYEILGTDITHYLIID